ncbi:MAG: hypothetical protein LBD91_00805 [Prevotellaceae bacterium]|nr:hypothetical protein [Prevotellaceae bacterium]
MNPRQRLKPFSANNTTTPPTVSFHAYWNEAPDGMRHLLLYQTLLCLRA